MTLDGLLALLAVAPDRAHRLGPIDALLGFGMVAVCGAVVIVDLRERIIPDACNALLAALGLGLALLDGREAAAAALAQGVVGFLLFWAFRALYRAVRGHHGLGLGDVKFLGAASTTVGLGGLPALILVACATALAAVGVARLRGRPVTAGSALPFGPFLVIGFLGVLAASLA